MVFYKTKTGKKVKSARQGVKLMPKIDKARTQHAGPKRKAPKS